jgi:hypothetical protein
MQCASVVERHCTDCAGIVERHCTDVSQKSARSHVIRDSCKLKEQMCWYVPKKLHGVISRKMEC